MSLNLRLPSGQMAVQKSASSAASAVKAAFDDLLQQIGKHKDLLRNTHKWQRRRVADFRAPSPVAFEDTVAAVQVPTASSDDIRTLEDRRLGHLSKVTFSKVACTNPVSCAAPRPAPSRATTPRLWSARGPIDWG